MGSTKDSNSLVPTPPNNLEAERAVLGSLIIDPEVFDKVRPILAPNDFYHQKNSWVYEAITELERRREPVDFVTLCDELDRRERLEDVGGAAYITTLINAVPSALHVAGYAGKVREDAIRRRILKAASQAAKLAYDRDHPLEDVLSQIETTVLHLRGEITFENRLRPFSEIMDETYAEMEAAYREKKPVGISSGYPDLDNLLGGFRPGNLILVGARPSIGKSSLLTSFAANALHNTDVPAVLFSLEMSSEEVAYRMMTMRTGINVQRLQSGRVKEEEWLSVVEHTGVLAELPLWVDDTPQIKVGDLRAKIRRLYAEQGLGMVLLDYVQLAQANRHYQSRYREIGEITAELKGLAKELNIPVIAASQLSRAVEHRAEGRPRLSDLRESGNQEADADVVILIHREMTGKYEPAELIVAKNRHGETGTVPVFWQGQYARFVSAQKKADAEPLAID